MKQGELYLRLATIEDKELLYEWRNDPVCRENSINSEKIAYDSHCRWFLNKLNSDECTLFICMKNNKPIGQIRIDYEDAVGKISYSIDSNFRGRGYGKKILELLENDKRLRGSITKLCAVVKENNIASQKCFKNLNYSEEYQGGLFYYSKRLQGKERK